LSHEVKYSKWFSEEYAELSRISARSSQARYLQKIIGKGTAKLGLDAEAGSKLPHYCLDRYEAHRKAGCTNLWKLKLDSYWRMLYTLIGPEESKVCLVLEVWDHKKYDRVLGFKGR
jgi:hypothetical protein